MIYTGNCLEILPRIENAAIVFTSPPYNMNLRISGKKYISRQIVKEFSTKYEGYDDNLSMDEYLDLNRKALKECLRIAPLVFWNVQFLTGNKVALFKLIGEFSEQLKEIIIWDKVNAQPAMHEGVLNSQFETILVFSKDAISREFRGYFERGTLSNLWSIKRETSKVKIHGATFPEALVEKIVKNFTKEGDIILDPFCGTGTTGVVCKRERREFIGIEMNEKYAQISEDRIDSMFSY